MEHGFLQVVADGSVDGLYYCTSAGDWLWTCETINPWYYNVTQASWRP